MEIIVTIVIIIFIYIALRLYFNKLKYDRLIAKYGIEIGKSLYEQKIWQGMTVEMLIDGLGKPADIDEKVLKTKTKRIYKFRQTGKNRFSIKVTVENDAVVGWDIK